jgi:hypothetical protein
MCSIHISLGSVATVIGFITSVLALLGVIVFGIWQIRIYRQLEANGRAIDAKEKEIDAVDPDITARTTDFNVTEGQRLAQIEHARKPLYRELEHLKRQREFIKDKLLFAKK